MEKRNNKLFGREVKKRLLDLGLSQKEFSDLTSIEYKNLGHVLNGYRPGNKYRQIICDKVGLDYNVWKNVG